MGDVTATWSISLDVECPSCEHYFDLTDGDEFFRNISPAEPVCGYEAECPKCGHEFICDFEY